MPMLTAPERFDSIASNYATSEVHRSSASISFVHALIGDCTNLRVLDVACGAGHFGFSFADRAARLCFCDPALAMLDCVRSRAKSDQIPIEAVQSLGEDLPFGEQEFDVVVSRLAPHHFTNPRGALAEMARVLVRGGHCAIIDLEGLFNEHFDQLNHQLEVLHDPTHVRSYSQAEWCEFFLSAGLTIERVQGSMHESEEGVTVSRWCQIASSGAEAESEIMRLLKGLNAKTLATLGIWADAGTFRLPVRTTIIFGKKC